MRRIALPMMGFSLLLAALCYGVEVRQFPAPRDAVFNDQIIALGEQLFSDTRLSENNTVACRTCHSPEFGWSDGRRISQGIRGRKTTRNAPTIINAGFKRVQFHDGRADFLEGQASQPLQARVEMGQQNLQNVTNRINNIPGYRAQFVSIFGRQATTADVMKSIAAFERIIVSSDAPIDRVIKWEMRPDRSVYSFKETWAFDAQQTRGMNIFVGKGNCVQCHTGPDYRNSSFANTGVASRFNSNDNGRGAVTNRDADNRKFAVPTLREIQYTAPYMHAGQFTTLEQVVEHYNNPPTGDRRLDARIRPLGLSVEDKAALVVFLKTAFKGKNYPNRPMPSLPR